MKPEFQKIEMDPIFPVKYTEMHTIPDIDLFYCHWHPNIEIIYISEGAVNMKIDSVDYKLYEGDICIINPNEVHYGVELNGIYSSVKLIVFSYDILNQNQNNVIFNTYIKPLKNGHLKLPNIIQSIKNKKDINIWQKKCHYTIKELINVSKIKPKGYEIKIQGLFLYLLSIFFENNLLSSTNKYNKQGISKREMDILSYIDEHFTENITVPQMASTFKVSEDYFYKLFKKTTGQTPIDYIIRMRINYAKQLLRTTTMSISEIGFEVGFESSSYFSKTFKKYTKKTPRNYRKDFYNSNS